MMKIAKTENEMTTEASYHVSYCIACNGEAHTIGETLIVKDIVLHVNKEYAKKIDSLQLSNNNVLCCFADLSTDIKADLIIQFILHNEFILQMDAQQ